MNQAEVDTYLSYLFRQSSVYVTVNAPLPSQGKALIHSTGHRCSQSHRLHHERKRRDSKSTFKTTGRCEDNITLTGLAITTAAKRRRFEAHSAVATMAAGVSCVPDMYPGVATMVPGVAYSKLCKTQPDKDNPDE